MEERQRRRRRRQQHVQTAQPAATHRIAALSGAEVAAAGGERGRAQQLRHHKSRVQQLHRRVDTLSCSELALGLIFTPL